ncbi:hypothetical protein KIN20_015741 [Parelaphostrongylus tenuis]|uniref:Uncharacterized protein n=1 Tax=Parelaphostrongylus tenuis TaxID=148309 RepID=A0AAD5QP91_PARTN|nr:hypothetical protein KIN20_015741 [Parelaphostrongylus tenuis]
MDANNVFRGTRRVSPTGCSKPEGAWQEEESLEVYKRKTTQRPPCDDSAEVIRLVKRHPRGEELYETIHFMTTTPYTKWKSMWMQAVTSAQKKRSQSTHTVEKSKKDIYPKEKEPVYYTVEKSTKLEKRTEEQDIVEEECLSPVKEMETTTLTKHHYEEGSDVAERMSTKSYPM